MKHLKIICILILSIVSLASCESKINNPKTESHKVWGNCGMCKKTIEKAVNEKGISKGVWDKNTKMILLSYDSTKTNTATLLKQIADVGYDNELQKANDEAYNKRPKCCHYERMK